MKKARLGAGTYLAPSGPMVASTLAPAGSFSGMTFRVATLAALFCSLGASAYAATQHEPSPVVALFFSGGPLIAVILWLQEDARRTGVGSVQDWGYFLLLAWPVVIPWYAFRTRGRDGWRLILLLFSLIGAAHISATLVYYTLWYLGQA